MRTVATALVLIAGAAVILWYGSTLNNSWVLGGLIGGLAALLLSIPISLTLFSHLSRRHDERMELMEQMDEEEGGAMHLARDYDYPVLPARRAYEVEAEGYTIREEDDWHEGQEEQMERRRSSRRLATPQSEVHRQVQGQRQNVARQNPNEAAALSAPRSQAYLPAPRQQAPQTQQAQQISELQQPEQGTTQRRNTKVLRSTSLNNISQHRMEALRMARKEAAQDADDDIEVSSTHYSRQERTDRTDRARQNSGNLRQYRQETQRTQRTSGSLRPGSNPSRNRSDEVSDTTSSKINRRQVYRASDEEDRSFQSSSRRRGQQEPETDYIDNQVSSRLTPLRRTPQTEQIVRRPRTKDLHYDQAVPPADDETDDFLVNRPLVRRAPYMYEDDELRQQLAQQIDPPTVRRSSRQEVWQEDD